jgi:hypothetical protein
LYIYIDLDELGFDGDEEIYIDITERAFPSTARSVSKSASRIKQKFRYAAYWLDNSRGVRFLLVALATITGLQIAAYAVKYVYNLYGKPSPEDKNMREALQKSTNREKKLRAALRQALRSDFRYETNN